MKLEKKLVDFALLKARCEAVWSQKALGFPVDTKINKLGKEIDDLIKYEADDALNGVKDRVEAERKRLKDVVLNGEEEEFFNKGGVFTEVQQSQYAALATNNKVFTEADERTREVWDRVVVLDDIKPITIKGDIDYSKGFKDEELEFAVRPTIVFSKMKPYAALMELINDGLIIVNED